MRVSGDSSRLERLDSRAARRWAMATRAAFATHRAEIDDLNVFPVPDRDTGTNLYMTLDSALEAAREASPGSDPGAEPTLAGDAAALARATLLAARGNSGVILSQLVRGLSEVIGEAATGGIDGPTLALAVRRASDRAYASVTRPVEGTILSVAAAAVAAELAAGAGSDLYAVASASLAAARVALAATTAQLPSLARAGVVDAGGMGYVLVLEALERVIAGELAADPRPEHTSLLTSRTPGSGPGTSCTLDTLTATLTTRRNDRGQPGLGGPAYEVMYLLSDSTDEAVSALRVRLDELGDSVLVVGGEDLWNVHVHVDDVGAAIEAGIEAGRPHRIAVTHFGDQERARTTPSARGAVAVVACAAGEGWPRSSAQPARWWCVKDRACASPPVSCWMPFVLPARDPCSFCPMTPLPSSRRRRPPRQPATPGIEVHVVRSQSAVQGIAALAVFEPTASAQDNLVAMSDAAAATRPGAVTVASKEAMTSAGPCYPGDVLGMVDGDVVAIGKDLAVMGAQVVARLLAGGGELLTVITGAGGGPELSAAVAESAREGGPDIEVSIIDGGQATYPLLLGVE